MALGAAVRQGVIIEADFKDKASSGLRTLQGNINETLGDTHEKSMGKQAGKSSVAVAALGRGVVSVKNGIIAVGAAATVGLGKSIGVAINFEQKMADVKAVTGATKEEFAALDQLAKDLGGSTKFSAGEAAEGIELLGMAGLSNEEIIASLAETLNLAAAGGLALDEAADIATNAMSGMGMPVQFLGEIVDGLAATASNSNTNVRQLGEGLAYAAPLAATAEIPFADVAAALGLLANAGVQAGRGGTSFNAAIREMLNLTPAQKDKLAELGVEITNHEGKLNSLSTIIGQLDAAGLSAKEMFELFGDEGGRAIATLVQQGKEDFDSLKLAIDNSSGAAEEMGKVKLATLQGAWKLTKSAMEGLMISIGMKFLPVMQTMLNEYINPTIVAFKEWADSVGGIEKMFDDSLMLISEFGTSVWNTLNSIFSDASFRDTFLKNFGNAFIAMFTSISVLAVNFMNNLFGMNGLVEQAAMVAWEPLKFAFSLIWRPITAFAVQGWNTVSKVIVDGANVLISEINSLSEWFGFAIGKIDYSHLTVDMPVDMETAWGDMKVKLGIKWDDIVQKTKDSGADIKKDWQGVGNALVQSYDTVVNPNLTTKFKETATNFGKDAADPMVETIDTAGKKIVEKAEPIGKDTGKNFGKGVKEELNNPTTGIAKTLEDTFAGVGPDGSFRQVVSNLGDVIGKRLGQGMSQGMGNAVTSVVQQGFQIVDSAIAQGGWGPAQTGAVIGGGIGGGIGFKLGGPQGMVLGAQIGSFIGGKSGGLFEGDDDPSEEKKLAASMIEAATQRGGVGNTKDFSLQGVDKQNLIRAFKSLGFNTADAIQIGEMAVRRRIFGREGQQINEMIFDWAVSSAVEKHHMTEQGQKWSERVGAAMKVELGIESGELLETHKIVGLPRTNILDPEHAKTTETASGFSGMVNSPTLFMAGEAGPELVNVTPRGASLQGGGWGGGRSMLNFNFNINAIDSRGVRQFVEEDARDVIVEMLQKESFRSANVVYQSGVTTDPSV